MAALIRRKTGCSRRLGQKHLLFHVGSGCAGARVSLSSLLMHRRPGANFSRSIPKQHPRSAASGREKERMDWLDAREAETRGEHCGRVPPSVTWVLRLTGVQWTGRRDTAGADWRRATPPGPPWPPGSWELHLEHQAACPPAAGPRPGCPGAGRGRAAPGRSREMGSPPSSLAAPGLESSSPPKLRLFSLRCLLAEI